MDTITLVERPPPADAQTEITFTGSYSPEDNKLRLRLHGGWMPREVYDETLKPRLRAHGFSWAPKQRLFVAPMWTPDREDFLFTLCGDIGPEEISLRERAEVRSERFDGYSVKRDDDGNRAYADALDLLDGAPLGEAVNIGHHRADYAQRIAARIERKLEKAVTMWQRSEWWTARAVDVLRHVDYKNQPDVRARRIKGIEADQRREQRSLDRSKFIAGLWAKLPEAGWLKRKDGSTVTVEEAARFIADRDHVSRCFPLAEYPRPEGVHVYEGPISLSSALGDRIITWEQAARIAAEHHAATMECAQRWISHCENRITYERAILTAQGGARLLEKAPRPKQLPLCNYRAPEGLDVHLRYMRGNQAEHFEQVEMTSAEYDSRHPDDKFTGTVNGTHRVRMTYDKRGDVPYYKRPRVCVFLTDSKTHKPPGAAEETPPPAPAPVRRARGHTRTRVEPSAKLRAVQATLDAGINAFSANQLFPTPSAGADQLVDVELPPGARILEPEAGTGNIVRAIRRRHPGCSIVAVELNSSVAMTLRSAFSDVEVRGGDFLDMTPDLLGTFDAVLANPPFERGADVDHVLHMLRFVKKGGIVRAIMSAMVRHREDSRTRQLREIIERSGGTIKALPDDLFTSQGTNVQTVLVTIRQA